MKSDSDSIEYASRPEPAVTGADIELLTYIFAKEPVFVRPVRSGPVTQATKLQVNDSGNLKAIKQLVDGQIFSTVYRGASEELQGVRDSFTLTAQNLWKGDLVAPVTKYKALTPREFDAASRNPDLPYRLYEEEGSFNPKRSELLCDGSLLRRGCPVISGFRYSVPFIKALTFPKDPTRRPEDFAVKCDKDLLTLDTLYLALFAWYDIVTGYQMNPGQCLRHGPNAADSTKVYLAECLVYYPHWLRFTEVTGLAEFVHFFRYVEYAVAGDRMHNDMIVPDDPDLSDEIKRLVLEIGKCRASPYQRFLVLPQMTKIFFMPRMINMEPYLFPSDGDLLMTGLPPVNLLGTPKYTHLSRDQGCNLIRLCIPKILARNSYHDPTSPLQSDQTLICNLMEGVDREGVDHPLEITGGVLKSGRIWRMDFTEVNRGPYYLHHTRHWIQEIVEKEVVLLAEGMGLHVSRQGFVTPIHYDTLKSGALRLPPWEQMIDERDRADRLKREQILDGPLFDSEEVDGPSPLANTILEILEQVPPMRCVA
ncbi:hypothetical protein HDV64DRAFT_290058 [Trichoderma sp. TUCIM 5745]